MKVGDLAYVLAPPSFTPENQKLAPIYYEPYELKIILENNNYKHFKFTFPKGTFYFSHFSIRIF